MQNNNIPTSAEVLNALTVLSKVSHHTDRHPLQVAVGLLANFEGLDAQKLHELFVSVGCAVRNFGEAVGEQIDAERDGYLRNSEYFDAQACRVYKRATDEFVSSFDEAQDVAQTIAMNAGEENPQTLDEYEDCADHDV
jgi:hypothetical protein